MHELLHVCNNHTKFETETETDTERGTHTQTRRERQTDTRTDRQTPTTKKQLEHYEQQMTNCFLNQEILLGEQAHDVMDMV